MRQIYLGNTLINDAFLGSDRMSDLILGEVSIPIGPDVDAENFFTASGITNNELKGAVTTFVVELKNNNLWDKMIQILPFVADTTASLATQFGYNLKNTGSFNPTFRLEANNDTILSGSNLNGYKASKGFSNRRYVNTNLFPNTEFINDGHCCIYTTDAVQSNGQNLDTWDWGLNPLGGSGSVVIVGRNTPDGFGNVQKIASLADNTGASVNTNPEAGCYIVSFFNTSGTVTTQYNQNGVEIANSTGSYRQPASNVSAFLGATNQSGLTPSIGAVSDRQYQLLTVGDGLTGSEMQTLNTIVHNFQENIDVALGTSRAV